MGYGEEEETIMEKITQEELEELREFFNEEFWPKMKNELKDMSKKEACFSCFLAGSDMMRYSIEKEFVETEKMISKMSEEEIIKTIREGNENTLWEDKTKINGVWVDDKTGKVLEE